MSSLMEENSLMGMGSDSSGYWGGDASPAYRARDYDGEEEEEETLWDGPSHEKGGEEKEILLEGKSGQLKVGERETMDSLSSTPRTRHHQHPAGYQHGKAKSDLKPQHARVESLSKNLPGERNPRNPSLKHIPLSSASQSPRAPALSHAPLPPASPGKTPSIHIQSPASSVGSPGRRHHHRKHRHRKRGLGSEDMNSMDDSAFINSYIRPSQSARLDMV
ncbi:hypothetical protein P7C70_g9646, partial [Phenoliferia sp. Uapishka_3]